MKTNDFLNQGSPHCLTSEFRNLTRCLQYMEDVQRHRRILNRLLGKIQDPNLIEYQRDQAYRELNQLYPGFGINANVFFNRLDRTRVENKGKMQGFSVLIN